jgi:galactose mutarotase-like enzyme
MKNEFLRIEIADKGAELTSIKNQLTGFEYLWQADAAVWGRHAPILFPIVGKVKDNMLLCNGQPYPMGQHGFARDQVFQKISETNNEVWYALTANQHTKAIYPYNFTLRLGYRLEKNTLTCSYDVRNDDVAPLYFSIGAHPGFNLPTGKLSDYRIEFAEAETEHRQLLSGGLFNGTTKPVFSTPNSITLNAALFDDDAIVLKKLNSTRLVLTHQNGSFNIQLDFDGFPYMGIWTQKGNEQYICLEPWCGHADSIDGHTNISEKEGIVKLQSAEHFNRSYSITFG